METKLDTRGQSQSQKQFPASFPDTFKNFFELMNEDEDNVELFANMLEDKVIPRYSNPMYPQRQRNGGSLRGQNHASRSGHGYGSGQPQSNHSNSSHSPPLDDPQRLLWQQLQQQRALTAFRGRSGSYSDVSQSRSSGLGGSGGGGGGSQRRRRRSSMSSSANCLNRMGCCGVCGCDSSSSGGSLNRIDQELGCRPINSADGRSLLCRHIHFCCWQQGQPPAGGQRAVSQVDISCSSQRHYGQFLTQQQQQQLLQRSVPDGHVNTGGPMQSNIYVRVQPDGSRSRQTSPSRSSNVLDGMFAFDTSGSNSPVPVPSPAPSQPAQNILRPILKQPQPERYQQQQHQQVHQQQVMQQQAQQPPQQQQQQAQAQQPPQQPQRHHRLLPALPAHSNNFQTTLQRVQLQSGYGSRNLMYSIAVGSSPTATPIMSSASASSFATSFAHYDQQQYQYQEQPLPDVGGLSLGDRRESGEREMRRGWVANDERVANLEGEWECEINSSISAAISSNGELPNKDDISVPGTGPNSSRLKYQTPKSPILSRRRSSSIVSQLLHGDRNHRSRNSITGTTAEAEDMLSFAPNTSDRMSSARKSLDRGPESSVLTFQQAMSGAVSPPYAPAGGGPAETSAASNEPDNCLLTGSENAAAAVVANATSSGPTLHSADSRAPPSTSKDSTANTRPHTQTVPAARTAYSSQQRERGVGESDNSSCAFGATRAATSIPASSKFGHHGSGHANRQRLRTASMPGGENRRPRLADTRSAVQSGNGAGTDYYRLRSFSITTHGVCNLGDSLRSRKSRSNNSVTSTEMDRNNSNPSVEGEAASGSQNTRSQSEKNVPVFKIAMLGASGVGKTTLTLQFTDSDYICAYDLSLDDDYGRKCVSVLVDNVETDLEMVDHPASEMSVEAFCATYNIDLFVVIYSVVNLKTYKFAERVLQYLKENDMLLIRGAILVGNKSDLQRQREVSFRLGSKLAKAIACKFIETSAGVHFNVDELLVGIVAQVHLNPKRIKLLSNRERQRLNMLTTLQNHRSMHTAARRMVRQMSVCQAHGDELDQLDDDEQQHALNDQPSTSAAAAAAANSRPNQVRKPNRRTLNLESILKMGDSEQEEEESSNMQHLYLYENGGLNRQGRPMSKFELLTVEMRQRRTSGNDNTDTERPTPSTLAAAAAAAVAAALHNQVYMNGDDDDDDDVDSDDNDDTLDCNGKIVSKLTARTKDFIASVLRFKRNMRRRHSSSCLDLFVI